MRTLEIESLPPRVVNYQNYHEFLRDFFIHKKSLQPRFSYRRFASLSGIKSSNFLMLVMTNKRNLSPEMARVVAKAMKLSRPECDYFVALVRRESLRDPDEILQAERQRKIAVKKIIAKDVPSDKAEYLSVWYYSLVRELAFLRDFVPTAAWIVKRLGGLITEEQADKAVRVLINLGFWKPVDGKILVEEVFLDTGLESKSFGEIRLSEIHRQTLLTWTRILDDLPKAERELGLINIPISPDKLPELKKRIQQFQDEIIGWLQDETEPTQLVQLGTYMIPVTKRIDL